MISSKKKFGIKAKETKQPKSYAAKIERELPYFVTLITLMASSGISPYNSLRKIMKFDILPVMKKEAQSMINQVEILGGDPLAVMNKKAELTSSLLYRDFLAGYVATVQAGGSIINFLKSKMWAIFDMHATKAKQLVTKLSGLVDAYMIIQVVILTMYIMFVAFTSTPSMGTSLLPDGESLNTTFTFFLMIPPLMAGMLMFISHQMIYSTYLGTKKILMKALFTTVVSMVSVVLLSIIGVTSQFEIIGLPYFVAIALLIALIIPLLDYRKMEKMNSSAELATPGILRDIAEARKTGLSPERCIIHGFTRKGMVRFQVYLTAL